MDFQWLSEILGTISLILFGIVFTPQLYENWKRKSGDGLSYGSIIIWILADVFAIVGLFFMEYFISQIAIHLFFLLMDLLMLIQCLYYQYLYKRPLLVNDGKCRTPLLKPDDCGLIDGERVGRGEEDEERVFLLGALVPVALSIMTTSMVTTSTSSIASSTTMTTTSSTIMSTTISDSSTLSLLPLILGYISALLFMCSRIPQIVLNFRKKSCEGLSLALFIIGVMGNLAYAGSVFLHSMEPKYLLEMAPWLLGCLGTIFLDIIIFFQFYFYSKDKGRGFKSISSEDHQIIDPEE